MANFAGLIPRADFADKEPRIRDLELGKKLGYASPVDVRKLVARLAEAGKLPGASVVATVAKTSGGRPGREYWLDERSALLVASQSGMPSGIDVTIEVIDVFVRYRRGELPTSPDPIHPLFARQRSEWEALWSPKVVRALCALYGNSKLYTMGGQMPGGWFAGIQRMIYEHVWDSEHVAEAIKRSPRARRGNNWHQHMTPEARAAFSVELDAIAEMATLCLDHTDPVSRFWERMRERYLSMPMQLGLRGMLISSNASQALPC
jgi:hypothetical protein